MKYTLEAKHIATNKKWYYTDRVFYNHSTLDINQAITGSLLEIRTMLFYRLFKTKSFYINTNQWSFKIVPIIETK